MRSHRRPLKMPPRSSSRDTSTPINGLPKRIGKNRCKRRGKIQTQGQSYRHAVTIDSFPDNVFLHIFDSCRTDVKLGGFPLCSILDLQRLAQVCQRWRRIIFASPPRLDLQLLCTYGTPVRKNSGYWPPIPLVIDYYTYRDADDCRSLTPSDEDDVIAALEHPDRVRYVGISVTRSLLGKMAAAMQEPFPILTHLWLSSKDGNVPVLPNAFFGGSAPRLRVAHLEGIPFPGLPTLLLSATDLVDLQLLNIPKTGYVSPDAMVAGLAALTRLETLTIEFQSQTPLPNQRCLPPLTRMVFPSLAAFNFQGVSEYLEDLVAQIDTPLLKNFTIMYFNQLTFQIPQLSQFISRTESLDLSRFKRARVDFNNVYVRLNCDQAEQLEGHFTLQISCQRLDWQVSHMAQVLSQCFASPTLSSVGDLSIDARNLQPGWEEDVDSTTEWPELLRPFPAVEMLHISKQLAGHVTKEMVVKMLTALRSLCFEDELTGVDP